MIKIHEVILLLNVLRGQRHSFISIWKVSNLIKTVRKLKLGSLKESIASLFRYQMVTIGNKWEGVLGLD